MGYLIELGLTIYRELCEELEVIVTDPDLVDRHCDATKAIHTSMNALAGRVRESVFKDETEEIGFFKCIKPMFTSQLVFHSKLFQTYVHWPATQKEQEEYVKMMILDPARIFHLDNRDFIRYSRSGNQHHDRYGYLRSEFDPILNFHPENTSSDLAFCTNYDQKQGVLMAYNDLEQYCLDGLIYGNAPVNTDKPRKPAPWRRSKGDWALLVDAMAVVKGFGDMTAQEIHDRYGPIVGVEVDLAGARRSRRLLKNPKDTVLDEMQEGIRRLDEEAE